MIQRLLKILICLFIVLLGFKVSSAQSADKIMIVIIDGARFTETLGDPSHTYTPKMWRLSQLGTTINKFSNNNYTYTSRALPALWCGAWTGVQKTTYNGFDTQYAVLPTLWEYYRKDKSMPANECFYISQDFPSVWLPSYDADYGTNYWPAFHCVGSSDEDVATQTQLVMDNSHPRLIWVYLAGVDEAGHSGLWINYTKAIFSADSIVGVLWDKIQSDNFYKNSTTLFVTNDHGRHNDQNGGFSGHGCSCEGCRHILFLAVGPSIKQNYISSLPRAIPDMSVTASFLLGINPTKAQGSVMQEIFVTKEVDKDINQTFKFNGAYPNPFSKSTTIRYFLNKPSEVHLSIYSTSGEEIITLVNEKQGPGQKAISWYGLGAQGQKASPGVYFYNLQVGSQKESGKLVLVKD